MIDLCIAPSAASVWVGCNSILSAEITEVIQRRWYLPQINEIPTLTAAVAETLNRAQRIASECEKELPSVTYDLATAKKALKIQTTESIPNIRCFFNLGAFYIEIVFFSALGK